MKRKHPMCDDRRLVIGAVVCFWASFSGDRLWLDLPQLRVDWRASDWGMGYVVPIAVFGENGSPTVADFFTGLGGGPD